jgi:hypothetical protein
MPRRSILSATERDSLLAWPEAQVELIRHYTLSETDLSIVRQHRGAANRLGYAVQLCCMRYPGVPLGARDEPFAPLLHLVATQLKVPVESWTEYGQRAETRREHALELQAIFGFKSFTMRHYRAGVRSLEELAWQTDKGIVLASALIDEFRRQQVLLPTLNNIERICAEAVTGANRRIYAALTGASASMICSNAKKAARQRCSLGCASRRQNRTRGTCSNMSNGSEICRHSICPVESSGRFIRTACSKSPARAVR